MAGLQDTCRLVPMLQQLGIRHAGYGLKESYFHLAGKILVDCISEGLGKSFTKEVENAWVMVSGFMVATMLSGFSTAQKDIQDAEERLRLSLHPSRPLRADVSILCSKAPFGPKNVYRKPSLGVAGGGFVRWA